MGTGNVTVKKEVASIEQKKETEHIPSHLK